MGRCCQSVVWALENPCPYRYRSGWQLPNVASEALFELRVLNECESFEGLCITDLIGVPDKGGRIHRFPIHGFEITGALLENGTSLCAKCPSNIGPEKVAGCHGWLNVDPTSEELHRWLEERVDALGIETELSSLFQSTKPRWFGLWIDSPLSSQQRAVFSKLFGALDEDEEFAHFHKALSSQLALHVSLSPPGHADLGWTTIFGHCDRCKALPNLDLNFDSKQVCRVCGHSYRPRDNQRTERLVAPTPIQKVVGDEEHRDFIRRWLQRKGLSDAQIGTVYENFLNRKFQFLTD